jgi:hypothetical protein
MGFDFSVEYKKGKEDIVANALSRRDKNSRLEKGKNWQQAEQVAVLGPVLNWLEIVKKEVGKDPALQEFIKKVREGEAFGHWEFRDGLLYYKDQIYLPANSALLTTILKKIHGNFHEGYYKTYKRVQANFYWKGMRGRVKDFIKDCDVCQRHKNENLTPRGLL